MAGIGLYGVFYALATVADGVVTGYNGGTKQMGKAISVSFEPNTAEDNPLYANNAVAENDSSGTAGGTITFTLDRLAGSAAADLFGLTQNTVSVTIGDETVDGTGFSYTGNETSNPVGVAFIRQKQEDGNRNIHEVVIYRRVMFSMPAESAQTMGESIEWQTPEIEGIVTGKEGDGTNAWYQAYTFESQAAAIAYIESVLGTPIV